MNYSLIWFFYLQHKVTRCDGRLYGSYILDGESQINPKTKFSSVRSGAALEALNYGGRLGNL